MKQQLTLINIPPSWRIDNQTKEIGRQGLEKARAALANAKRPVDELDRAA